MSRFSGKSVLITGASRGLGRQLAVDFAQEGAKVAVNYFSSAEAAEETVARIEADSGQAVACKADIACSDDVKAMVDQVVREFGGVDVLINNAGLSMDAPLLEMSEHAWDRVVGVNLKGPFLVSQAVGRHMVAAKQGRIVNISATTAVQARAGNANYCASKAGLNMFTQSLALELAPHVTVNAVALGFVDSDLLREVFTEHQIEQARNGVPLKRMTTFQETSSFVRMLASDTASFVTGQTIPFDGGRVMR